LKSSIGLERGDMDRFRAIGAIKNSPIFDGERLDNFLYEIDRLRVVWVGVEMIWYLY